MIFEKVKWNERWKAPSFQNQCSSYSRKSGDTSANSCNLNCFLLKKLFLWKLFLYFYKCGLVCRFLVPMMPVTTWEIFFEALLIPLQPHPPPHCRITHWYNLSLLLHSTVPLQQHQKVVPLLKQLSVGRSYSFLCATTVLLWKWDWETSSLCSLELQFVSKALLNTSSLSCVEKMWVIPQHDSVCLNE